MQNDLQVKIVHLYKANKGVALDSYLIFVYFQKESQTIKLNMNVSQHWGSLICIQSSILSILLTLIFNQVKIWSGLFYNISMKSHSCKSTHTTNLLRDHQLLPCNNLPIKFNCKVASNAEQNSVFARVGGDELI